MWEKMITAIRESGLENGELLLDRKALVILDEEVRHATEELKQSKENLATLIAKQMLGEETGKEYQKSVNEYEGYTEQALAKGDEALALEVAQKIAEIEQLYAQEQASVSQLGDNVNELRYAIKQAEQNVKCLKHQVDTVKATESVLRAQMAVAQRYNEDGSQLTTAMESLERIKARQQAKGLNERVADGIMHTEIDEALKAKLAAAGIVSNGQAAQEVLARIKSK